MTINLRDGFGSDHQRQWVLGTTEDCDVRLLGSQVSGRVARLCNDRDSWTIAPLDGAVSVRGEQALRVTPIDPRDDVRIAGVALPWPSTSGARNHYTVGRSRNCDIRIGLPGVSGQHARLIVGHHGTYVLEDLRSTNGIFADAERRHPVRFIQINRDITVYFGSTPIAARDLIDALTSRDAVSLEPPVLSKGVVFAMDAAPEPTKQKGERSHKLAEAGDFLTCAAIINSDAPPSVGRDNRKPQNVNTKKRSSSRNLSFVSSLVTLPLMIALVLWGKGFWQGNIQTDATPPIAAKPLELPNLELPNKPESVDRAEVTAALPVVDVEATDASEALYWVLVEAGPEKSTYRLGTAVAVGSDRLLTTGSIVMAGEKLCEQLDGVLLAQHIQSGKRSAIHQTSVHPALVERLRIASVAKQQFDEAGQDSSSRTDDQERETSSRLELVNLSFSAASSADVGWLKVADSLKGLPLDSQVKIRPRQAVTIYHCGFDTEDPFLDASMAVITTAVPTRIDEIAPTLQSIQGHARILLGPELAGLNLLGSPMVAAGRLIGIVSYTEVAEENNIMAEIVAPSVMFQALNTAP